MSECDKGPCGACPWRKSNQGTPHPDGWYTKLNLARLWSKLRRGESMSCHPTDPRNPVPEGTKPVPEGTKVRECAGALILVQREAMRFQDDPRAYFKKHKGGMTKKGLVTIMNRAIFGRVPFFGDGRMPTPDLNEPDIQYSKLEPWETRT